MSITLPVSANFSDRPDVLAIRIHLARLEKHFAVLELQRARADGRCNRVAGNPEGVSETDLFRAEQFANRIESQIHRALKELRKTQLELDKALAAEPETPPARSTASGGRKSPEVTAAANPPPSQEAPAPSPAKSEQTTHNVAKPDPTAYTVEEFKNITSRYRQRIQSTPEEGRLALILRLIEEHRVKTAQNPQPEEPSLPKPSQNGKHAA